MNHILVKSMALWLLEGFPAIERYLRTAIGRLELLKHGAHLEVLIEVEKLIKNKRD